METFSKELIEQAKQAKNIEEILTIAKENGVRMTTREADAYYAKLHSDSCELSDDELENVAGGGCQEEKPYVCDDWDPINEGESYSLDNDPCPRCRYNGAYVYRQQWLSIREEDNKTAGAPSVPNDVRYCLADDY